MGSVVTPTAFGLVQINEAANMRAYNLDGMQQAHLSQSWAMRISVLESQSMSVGLNTFGAFSNIAIIASIFRLVSGTLVAFCTLKKLDPKCSNELSVLLDATKDLSLALESGIDKILDFATPYFDVICVAAYVAMIAFGHTLTGGIGLAAVAISQIKQHGYLPAILDEFLTPAALAATITATWYIPAFLIFRILGVIQTSVQFIDYMVASDKIRPYLPSCLSELGKKEHNVESDCSLRTYYTNADVVKGLLEDPEAWEINMSHVNAPEVDTIIPKDLEEKMKKRDFKELFESLEKKFQTTGVKLTEDEQKGLGELKWSMINNRCKDVRPVNFDQTRDIIKAILISLLEEEDTEKFESKAKTFAIVGNSCTEGWLRDCNYLLNPESKDYKWVIHSLLAEYRSGLLQEAVVQGERMLKEITKVLKMPPSALTLDLAGGANNIHLLNQTSACLFMWRTGIGERYMRSTGRGIFTAYLQSRMSNKIPKHLINIHPTTTETLADRNNMEQAFYSDTQMKLPLPGIPPVLFSAGVHEMMMEGFTAERLVDRITVAVKPERYLVDILDKDGEVTEKQQRATREIEWDQIQTWLGELQELTAELSETHENVFDSLEINGETPFYKKMVKKEVEGERLTTLGSRFLLWSMGILQPTKEARERAQPHMSKPAGTKFYATKDREARAEELTRALNSKSMQELDSNQF